MTHGTETTTLFWDELERNVAHRVDVALRAGTQPREPLIAYLRDLEQMARAECDRRQTIQIIASGRSLLGDRSFVGPADGPFAHSL